MKLLNTLRAAFVALTLAAPALAGPPAIPPSVTIGVPKYYKGQIATRSMLNQNLSANTTQMLRTAHYARDKISSLQVVWYNGYITSAGETAITGNTTYTASIEYPSGTCTPMKFSGVSSGVAGSGALITSDPLTINIPRGALFWVRSWQSNSNGTAYVYKANAIANDPDTYESPAVADKTSTCAALVAGGGNWYSFPQAIIGQTNRPSVFIVGDSRQMGAQETSVNPPYDYGEVAPLIGGSFAYINAGISGASAINEKTQIGTIRQALMKYTTHGVDALGINDIGRSGATAAADRNAVDCIIAANVLDRIVIDTTTGPYTTSIDSWATTTNQTVTANESNRTSQNSQVRSGTAFVCASGLYIDLDQMYDPNASGKWPVGGLYSNVAGAAVTLDGLHPNRSGEYFLQWSGQFKPTVITH